MKVEQQTSIAKLNNSWRKNINKPFENIDTDSSITQMTLSKWPEKLDLIHFGANYSQDDVTFYEQYGTCGAFPSFMTALRNSVDESDLYDTYCDTYKNIDKCHSVSDMSSYSELADFGNIKSIGNTSSNNSMFVFFKKQYESFEQQHPEKDPNTDEQDMLFPDYKTNDLALYLTKKYYGELLPRDTIEEDIVNDINKNVTGLQPFLKQNSSGKPVLPLDYSIYRELNIKQPQKEAGCRKSLQTIKRQKAEAEKTIKKVCAPKIVTARIPIAPEESYKMKYAWCQPEMEKVRIELCDTLLEAKLEEANIADAIKNVEECNITDASLQKIMTDFWNEDSTRKEALSIAVTRAIKERDAEIAKGKFKDFQQKVDAKKEEVDAALAPKLKIVHDIFQESLKIKQNLINDEALPSKILQDISKMKSLDTASIHAWNTMSASPNKILRQFYYIKGRNKDAKICALTDCLEELKKLAVLSKDANSLALDSIFKMVDLASCDPNNPKGKENEFKKAFGEVLRKTYKELEKRDKLGYTNGTSIDNNFKKFQNFRDSVLKDIVDVLYAYNHSHFVLYKQFSPQEALYQFESQSLSELRDCLISNNKNNCCNESLVPQTFKSPYVPSVKRAAFYQLRYCLLDSLLYKINEQCAQNNLLINENSTQTLADDIKNKLDWETLIKQAKEDELNKYKLLYSVNKYKECTIPKKAEKLSAKDYVISRITRELQPETEQQFKILDKIRPSLDGKNIEDAIKEIITAIENIESNFRKNPKNINNNENLDKFVKIKSLLKGNNDKVLEELYFQDLKDVLYRAIKEQNQNYRLDRDFTPEADTAINSWLKKRKTLQADDDFKTKMVALYLKDYEEQMKAKKEFFVELKEKLGE